MMHFRRISCMMFPVYFGFLQMHPLAIREKVIALLKEGKSQKEIAEFLNISVRTIQRWQKAFSSGQTLVPQNKTARKRKIDKEKLLSYIREFPDKTLKEMGKVFGVAHSSIERALKKLSITFKKNPAVQRAQRRSTQRILKAD